MNTCSISTHPYPRTFLQSGLLFNRVLWRPLYAASILIGNGDINKVIIRASDFRNTTKKSCSIALIRLRYFFEVVKDKKFQKLTLVLELPSNGLLNGYTGNLIRRLCSGSLQVGIKWTFLVVQPLTGQLPFNHLSSNTSYIFFNYCILRFE